MDLLRFLLLLPLRLVRGLFAGMGLILRPLLGDVSWSAPVWLPATGGWIRRRPARASGLLVATHLALCPHCRLRIGSADALGGFLLVALAAAPVSPSMMDAVLARVQ